MTATDDTRIKRAILPLTRSIALLAVVLLFALFLSDEAAEYTVDGLKLALLTVIPTAFPSMLLSDIYTAYGSPESLYPIRLLFVKAFGINAYGLRPYILGNLCGFPLGAKSTAEAYMRGELDRSESERLIALSSNPSPAFVIGAVGMGMLGDVRTGILLLVSLYLSSIICGTILKSKQGKTAFMTVKTEQKYSFVKSVRSSGESSVVIASFITAFSIIGGFIKKYVTPAPLRAIVFSITEVTMGVKYFTSDVGFSAPITIALVAFTLGFGGISVLLQSSAFVKPAGLSMRYYVPIKLLQGAICGLLSSASYLMLFR